MNKLTLVAFTFFALIATIAFAQQQQDPKQNRQFNPNIGDSSVSMDSQMRQNPRDKLNFEMQTSDDINLNMKYAGGLDLSQGVYKIKLGGIIEYLPSSADGSFTPNVSTVVQDYRFKPVGFTPIKCDKSQIDTNTTLFNCTVSTRDNVVTAQVFFTDTIIEMNQTRPKPLNFAMKPTSMKWSVLINNFPYKNAASSLALVAKIVTERNCKEKADSDERKAGFVKTAEKQLDIGTEAFFSWATSAIADGSSISVINTQLQKLNGTEAAEPNENRMFFSFIAKAPKAINWDPKLSVADSTSSGAAGNASRIQYSIIGLVICALMLLL